MKNYIIPIYGTLCLFIGIYVGGTSNSRIIPPPVELKPTYLIDNELYKPVNVLGCTHLQTARKDIHAWSLCRNPIHFNR